MPIPNRLTNPGRQLRNHYFGGESDTVREIPPEFRAALDLTVLEIPLPWDQEIIPLSDTVLASKAEQKVTAEWIRRTTFKPPGIVSLHEVFTNKNKQLVTRTRNFKYFTDPIASPSGTLDVKTQDLGNKHFIEDVDDTGFLFANRTYTEEQPDLIPEKFRGIVPTSTWTWTDFGVAVDPLPMAPGDLLKQQKQADVFTVDFVHRFRDVSGLPVNLDDYQTTEEYGGGISRTRATLDTIPMMPDQGLTVIKSAVTTLNIGLYLKETEHLWPLTDVWPILIGTEVDPRTGIAIGITKQVVDAGTTGGVAVDGTYYDVKPIDKWRSIQIGSKLDPTTLPDPVTWITTVEHRFPNTLLGVAFIWAAASGTLAYDFDMALVLDMLEGYAGPCRALVTESFSNGPPGGTETPTIFCPQAHVIGYSWAFAADTSSACDSCTDVARASARTWSIPPSLHDALTIGGAVTLTHGSFTNTLPATTPVSLPAAGTLIVKSIDVERWRFGVFYRRKTEIYVPDCG